MDSIITMKVPLNQDRKQHYGGVRSLALGLAWSPEQLAVLTVKRFL